MLEILGASRIPLTLKQIHERGGLPDFSGVYRTVTMLRELALVEEFFFGGRERYYALTGGKKHFHYIRCSQCGSIEILYKCWLDQVKAETSFEITGHAMEITGICPDCQK